MDILQEQEETSSTETSPTIGNSPGWPRGIASTAQWLLVWVDGFHQLSPNENVLKNFSKRAKNQRVQYLTGFFISVILYAYDLL